MHLRLGPINLSITFNHIRFFYYTRYMESCRFIDQGLAEELNNFFKIESPNKEIEFSLFGSEYKLTEPIIKERDAVYMSLTYHCKLFVPARLIKKINLCRDTEPDFISGRYSFDEF